MPRDLFWWFAGKKIRRDLDDFFAYGCHKARNSHCPVLVVEMVDDGCVEFQTISCAVEALAMRLPDDALLIRLWHGEHSSNFFAFTVGELRKRMEES